MAIVDKTKQRFDENLKTDKQNLILAFIHASNDVDKYKITNKDLDFSLSKKDKIHIRNVNAIDLFKKDGRGTFGGSLLDYTKLAEGTLSEEYIKTINSRFDSLYTCGGEMGIWINSNLELNELAKKVAQGEITIRNYMSVVFLNLFSFFCIHPLNEQANTNKQLTYRHFLKDIITYIQNYNLKNESINKQFLVDIFNFYEEDNETKRNNQRNILFDYITSTEFFVKINSDTMKVSDVWKNRLDELSSYCNLQYENSNLNEVKDAIGGNKKQQYSQYVTQHAELLNPNKIKEQDITYNDAVKTGRNIIYYGAPGTGKSNIVSKEYPDFERVTFHPEYTYSDFVGGLKPIWDEAREKLIYTFQPGPFTLALKNAFMNPSLSTGIIIEEINRANTAGVFGDIFQLLDRNEDFKSQYTIKNDDIVNYLNNNLNNIKLEAFYIPSNFSIIATMNSADQGVFIMDSAFKRRWEFEYISIDFENSKFKDIILPIINITWKKFAETINKELSNLGIEEDKLIGPYFLKENEFESAEKLASKLLIYLWDDVVKYKRASIFTQSTEFSKIAADFKSGKNVFIERINIQLMSTEERPNTDTIEEILEKKESEY